MKQIILPNQPAQPTSFPALVLDKEVVIAQDTMMGGKKRSWVLQHEVGITTKGFIFKQADNLQFGFNGWHPTVQKAIENALSHNNTIVYSFDNWIEASKWLATNS